MNLRERKVDDLPALWRWVHGTLNAEWKQWDAPYFHEHESRQTVPLEVFVERTLAQAPKPDERVVTVDGVLVGMVTRSRESPQSGGWWDLGIVLYDPDRWGAGVGTSALKLWIEATFRETEAHVLTLTTWSGNERMIRAGLRAGFRECARVREARMWRGRRYDSVKLDLLRMEWAPVQP